MQSVSNPHCCTTLCLMQCFIWKRANEESLNPWLKPKYATSSTVYDFVLFFSLDNVCLVLIIWFPLQKRCVNKDVNVSLLFSLYFKCSVIILIISNSFVYIKQCSICILVISSYSWTLIHPSSYPKHWAWERNTTQMSYQFITWHYMHTLYACPHRSMS